ncbi:MAG: hypothetical protein ACP5FL_09650, partial [Thermoplasmatota archaeon]
MFDHNEEKRRWLNMQIIKMKNIAALGSLFLLALNLAFTIYPYIQWRGLHSHLGVPLLFICILFTIWLLSHLYIRVMEMNRTEKRAEVLLNPYNVY